MTENEAQSWVQAKFGASAYQKLSLLVRLVERENEHQNLVSRSTLANVWARHVVDSMQLLELSTDRSGVWLDIGTGGGFPGLAIATARPDKVILVEPRQKRADFLRRAAYTLGLHNTEVQDRRVQSVKCHARRISARAVAPVEDVLAMAYGCSTPETQWLLPRGRGIDGGTISHLQMEWNCMFHVEQSVVDDESKILILDKVMRR